MGRVCSHYPSSCSLSRPAGLVGNGVSKKIQGGCRHLSRAPETRHYRHLSLCTLCQSCKITFRRGGSRGLSRCTTPDDRDSIANSRKEKLGNYGSSRSAASHSTNGPSWGPECAFPRRACALDQGARRTAMTSPPRGKKSRLLGNVANTLVMSGKRILPSLLPERKPRSLLL